MNAAPKNTPISVDASGSQDKPWSAMRWTVAIAVVFGLHVGLIYALGSRKPIGLRPVKNAPVVTLTSSLNEFQQLDDCRTRAVSLRPRGCDSLRLYSRRSVGPNPPACSLCLCTSSARHFAISRTRTSIRVLTSNLCQPCGAPRLNRLKHLTDPPANPGCVSSAISLSVGC